MGEQMIFKRTEIKYMLTEAQYKRLRDVISEYMIEDEHGESIVQSLYYDTPNYLLIRRSMEHPVYKEKLRIRSYGVANENSTIFVELKKKYDSVVYKRRIELQEKELVNMPRGNRLVTGAAFDSQIGHEIAYCFSYYDRLAPAVLLIYKRSAFYSKDDHEFRMTFDRGIMYRDYDLDLKKGIYGQELLKEHQVLLEVKAGGAIPMWLSSFLSKEKIYKSSFSKYAAAYTHMQSAI